MANRIALNSSRHQFIRSQLVATLTDNLRSQVHPSLEVVDVTRGRIKQPQQPQSLAINEDTMGGSGSGSSSGSSDMEGRDVHIIIEYGAKDTFGGFPSVRANRLILHRDNGCVGPPGAGRFDFKLLAESHLEAPASPPTPSPQLSLSLSPPPPIMLVIGGYQLFEVNHN